MRLTLRAEVVRVALVLAVIPLVGYVHVKQMERFLVDGQEQALLATARAIATALHDRPGLMAPSAERGAAPRVRAEQELARLAAQRGEVPPAPAPADGTSAPGVPPAGDLAASAPRP